MEQQLSLLALARFPRARAAAAIATALLLASCGGGGSSGSGSGSSDWAATGSATVNANQRIEPLDTSLPAAAKASSTGASSAPAQAAVAPAAVPVVLPVPAAVERAQGLPSAAGLGKRQAIGMARSVDATRDVVSTAALLSWSTTGGRQVAALRFASQDAAGVRLGVLVRSLPEGAVLRFYGTDTADVETVTVAQVQAIAERNRGAGADDVAAHTVWSQDFGGGATTLEIDIPAGAAARTQVQLAVPQISHLFTRAQEAGARSSLAKVGQAGACHADVRCDAGYDTQSRSVALMEFVDRGTTYVCTGTLLSDAAGSGTPYLLSANHCISTQAVASTLVTTWFYRSTSCNSGVPNPGAQRVAGGAALLYQTDAMDTTFLRLNFAPPAGVLYSGSYFGALPTGATLAGIHQPDGDLQKLSVGTLNGYADCDLSSCSLTDVSNGSTFLRLNWQRGTTEGGSSGSSALYAINGQRYVVGQLLGGTASCSNPGGNDYYGRYEQSYKTALYRWLNP